MVVAVPSILWAHPWRRDTEIVGILTRHVLILQGSLGARFPECLEEIVLGRVRENVDSEKRDTAVVRSVLKKVLIALKRLHSLGKPLPHHPYKRLQSKMSKKDLCTAPSASQA